MNKPKNMEKNNYRLMSIYEVRQCSSSRLKSNFMLKYYSQYGTETIYGDVINNDQNEFWLSNNDDNPFILNTDNPDIICEMLDNDEYRFSVYIQEDVEISTVRDNIMSDEYYTPYCGSFTCNLRSPRTNWSGKQKQFTCKCGWSSNFPQNFIKRYISKYDKNKKSI